MFATNLTDEYQCLLDIFDLSGNDVIKLACDSIDYIFESEEAKVILRQYFDEWRKQNEKQ